MSGPTRVAPGKASTLPPVITEGDAGQRLYLDLSGNLRVVTAANAATQSGQFVVQNLEELNQLRLIENGWNSMFNEQPGDGRYGFELR